MLLRSTWLPPEPVGPKIDDVFDDTKRRPFTRVSVRCEPRPRKSTKLWPAPKPDWPKPTGDAPGTPKDGNSFSACATDVNPRVSSASEVMTPIGAVDSRLGLAMREPVTTIESAGASASSAG